MPDWRAYVQDRLGALSASDVEREEIVSELAEHLEQHYADLRASGVDEQEAYRNTCAQAGNWEELRRGIVLARQEGTVSDRVKQIWLPGLATFLFSYIVLALLQWAGMRPLLHHWARSGSVLFYAPWLLTLSALLEPSYLGAPRVPGGLFTYQPGYPRCCWLYPSPSCLPFLS